MNEFKDIEKLSDYIQIFENLQRDYPGISGARNPVLSTFVFRGHSKESYPLVPGLYRKDEHIFEGRIVANEKYLVFATERSIIREFINCASSIIKLPTDDYVHWTEYAQHYGVPTRFLDWSKSPLVALYFACINEVDDGCVYALHSDNYRAIVNATDKKLDDKATIGESISSMMLNDNRYRHEMPLIYQPYYVDQRMAAQQSIFLSWGEKHVPLDQLIPKDFQHSKIFADDKFTIHGFEKTGNGCLFKLRIPENKKQSLLRELDVMGINTMTLFPGLDGIGKHIEKKFRFNYNEAIDSFF